MADQEPTDETKVKRNFAVYHVSAGADRTKYPGQITVVCQECLDAGKVDRGLGPLTPTAAPCDVCRKPGDR